MNILPFNILVPGGDAIPTTDPGHMHVVLIEHEADDNPRTSSGTKFVTRQECRLHVMDLLPCEHGWRYDAFSRAMARNDSLGMIEAIQAELRENLDRKQLAALGRP